MGKRTITSTGVICRYSVDEEEVSKYSNEIDAAT